jgi:hypothetical protein
VQNYQQKDPTAQVLFALDIKTGREERKYPVLWTTGSGGVHVPGAISPDGRMYLNIPKTGSTYMARVAYGWLELNNGNMKLLGTRDSWMGSSIGWGQMRVVGDETSKFSFSGNILLNSHHDNLTALMFDPAKYVWILGQWDDPVLPDAPQWYANHDNHPSFHCATVGDGKIFWLNQGDWLFAVEHEGDLGK